MSQAVSLSVSEVALNLLSKVQRWAVEQPNVTIYNAALSACEKAGRWEEAADLLATMWQEGCAPDEVTD